MVQLATNAPTLLDFARRSDNEGKVVSKIIEIAAEVNEVLEDIPWVQGNLPTGHKSVIRTGYPEATWRKLNYGVQPTKSTTFQVTDSCGMLEAYAEVDKRLAELNGNSQAWRASEDRAHLIGMSEQFAQALFYGDQTIDPERITGFAPRFTAPSTDVTRSGYNMIDGGAADGQTDCLSIWGVAWGEHSVHGIVPKGSEAMGWKAEDLGEVTLTDAAGGRLQGYRSHYLWDCGLCVRDWRYIVRICNIDKSSLTKNAATGADLIDLLTQLVERFQDTKVGKPVIYVPRVVKSFLRRQINAKVAPSTLTMENVAGKHVMTFDGVPVKRVDALVDETAILDAAGTFNPA